MRTKRMVGYILASLGLLVGTPVMYAIAASSSDLISTKVAAMEPLSEVVSLAKVPKTTDPSWLQHQKATKTVTYVVETSGVITASITEFKTLANETLNDSRGWAAMGVRFEEVPSGGMFTLVLSQASLVPSFSSICDASYSCTVGNSVIINQDRWLNASAPWNQAGKSLRDYRNLVVNHETGHWLGHTDTNSCSGVGQPAPVMAQQSLYASSCVFNPWPLASELWSTRLGISL